MKKTIALIVVICICLISFFGCTGSKDISRSDLKKTVENHGFLSEAHITQEIVNNMDLALTTFDVGWPAGGEEEEQELVRIQEEFEDMARLEKDSVLYFRQEKDKTVSWVNHVKCNSKDDVMKLIAYSEKFQQKTGEKDKNGVIRYNAGKNVEYCIPVGKTLIAGSYPQKYKKSNEKMINELLALGGK